MPTSEVRSQKKSRKSLSGWPVTISQEEGERILELYKSGVAQDKIKRRLKHNSETIQRVLAAYKVEIRKWPKKFNATEEQAICDDYLKHGYGSTSLAKKYACSWATIINTLKRRNIPLRRRGGDVPSPYRTGPLVDQICELYRSGRSRQSIADELKCGKTTITKVLWRNGIETGIARGSRNSQWKGGRLVDAGGYIRLKLSPEHPYWGMTDVSGYVAEHRLVIAQQLGRLLTPTEQVHHINGKKDDNRPENLQLQQRHHGTGHKMQCADCGSYNVHSVKL